MRQKTYTLKTTEHCWKQMKDQCMKRYPVRRVENLLLLWFQDDLKQSIESIQFLIKIPMTFSGAETERSILKFLWNPNRQSTLGKGEQKWRSHTPQFQNSLQSYSLHATDIKTDIQSNGIEEIRNNPGLWSNDFWQGCQDCSLGKVFNKWCWEN